jgi:hypothetical protein
MNFEESYRKALVSKGWLKAEGTSAETDSPASGSSEEPEPKTRSFTCANCGASNVIADWKTDDEAAKTDGDLDDDDSDEDSNDDDSDSDDDANKEADREDDDDFEDRATGLAKALLAVTTAKADSKDENATDKLNRIIREIRRRGFGQDE